MNPGALRHPVAWFLGSIAALAAVGVIVSFAVVASQDNNRNTWAPGAGMMNGYGGSGTMGGYGGSGMMGTTSGSGPVGSVEEAKQRVEKALSASNLRGFRVGEIMRFSNHAYAAVEESDGQGAMEILVDYRSGAVFPEPGPNMMWNTRYGMMAASGAGMMGGGMMGGPSADALSTPSQQLSPAQARAAADRWLVTARPGEKADQPVAFPGYYTMDTRMGDRVARMLSVNATTGAVWYHDWHTRFIDEREW